MTVVRPGSAFSHRLLAQRLQRPIGFAVDFLDGLVGELADRRCSRRAAR